jgi:hypothetical protein
MNEEQLKSTVKVCMFDQYGTVVDMQAGLVEAVTPFLRAKGWQGNPNSFVTWWRRTHFENSMIDALLHRDHTPYREIGERSVAYVMDRAGISHTLDEVREMVDNIVRLRPFPEVPAALDRLRPRSRTMASRSNAQSRLPRPIHSSRMSRPTPGQRRSSACGWTKCCSSPTTRSTASVRRRPGWARRSLTAASVHSARRRINRICWFPA